MEKLGNVKKQLSTKLGLQPEEDPDALEELSELCPKLSFQQRVIGFCSCFSLGYLITFGSFGLFIKLMEGDPIPYCFTYTLGNILSIFSSTFLCGPGSQLKSMFHESRRYTSIVYLTTLVLSLIFCFVPMDHNLRLGILIVLVIVQFLALTWYCISYIPFARRVVKKKFQDTIGLEIV